MYIFWEKWIWTPMTYKNGNLYLFFIFRCLFGKKVCDCASEIARKKFQLCEYIWSGRKNLFRFFRLLRLCRLIRCLLIVVRLFDSSNTIRSIIDTALIHWVQPSLILKKETVQYRSSDPTQGSLGHYQINDKHNVITEAGQTMCGRHRYDECKYIIDECIECFVHERTPWQRGHRFQFVVDK